MSTVSTRLRIRLLGVEVRVHCEEPSAAERLAICYQTEPYSRETPAGTDTPLNAELGRTQDGWRIRVDGFSADETAAEPPLAPEDLVGAVRSFNHQLLHGVMRRRPDLFFVHAGVVSLAGRGIVLPGISQAGKSTLVLELVRRGAQLLSDELLAFDASRQQCLAFPRAIKIRDVCLEYFPGQPFVGDGEGRFLPFSALPENSVAESAPLHTVVVPRFDTQGSNLLEPITRGRTLLSIAESALNFGTHREASVDHLSDMVQHARTWRLSWSHPGKAVERIVEALGAEPQ